MACALNGSSNPFVPSNIMTLDSLTFILIKSGLEHVDRLNERIYNEADRDGYHNLTTETKEGLTSSVIIFKNLKNADHVKVLLDGYEFLNNSRVSFGKVKAFDKYLAKEYSGSPVRIKVKTEFDDDFDLPLDALDHPGLNG
jgi:hypothetical protein